MKQSIFIKINIIIILFMIVAFGVIPTYKEKHMNSQVKPDWISNVHEDTSIKQYFSFEKNSKIKTIGVSCATFSNTVETDGLYFSVYKDEECVVEQFVERRNIEDNSTISITLPEPMDVAGQEWYLEIRGSNGKQESLISPAIYKTDDTKFLRELYVNGEKQEDQLAISVTYDTIRLSDLGILIIQLFVLCMATFYFKQIFRFFKKKKIVAELVLLLLNIPMVDILIKNVGTEGVSRRSFLVFLTYVLILGIEGFIYSFVRRSLWTILVTDAALYLLALINYFVFKFKGVPFYPSDIFSSQALMNIMDEYKIAFSFHQYIYLSVLLTLLVLCICFNRVYKKDYVVFEKTSVISLLKKNKGKLELKLKKLSLVFSVILCLLSGSLVYMFTLGSFYTKLKVDVVQANQIFNYCTNGVVLNFSEFIQFLKISKPKGYSMDKAKAILSKYETQSAINGDDKPVNVIMIMNESLTDYYKLINNDSIQLTEDPLPNLHKMQENVISGDVYVSTYGGGTANSEFEAITSNSVAFLPGNVVTYQMFPDKNYFGITRQLKDIGYNCYAIHPYIGNTWNRNIVYENMGFDYFYSIDDFENPKYLRYISDESSYSKLEELYENNEGNPLFLFNVTIQGHGPYTFNFGFDHRVSVKDRDYPDVSEYLSNTYESDQAFSDLVAYFSKKSEPVLICMFGDHHPSLNDEFMSEVFVQGGMQNVQEKYKTPYIIWTNYDIEEKQEDVSLNYLAEVVKEAAGIPLSSYDLFLKDVKKQIPIMNINGYQDISGNWHEYKEKNEYSDLLQDYNIVQYAIFVDGMDVK